MGSMTSRSDRFAQTAKNEYRAGDNGDPNRHEARRDHLLLPRLTAVRRPGDGRESRRAEDRRCRRYQPVSVGADRERSRKAVGFQQQASSRTSVQIAPRPIRKMPFMTPSRCAANPIRMLAKRGSTKSGQQPQEKQEHPMPHQAPIVLAHGGHRGTRAERRQETVRNSLWIRIFMAKS